MNKRKKPVVKIIDQRVLRVKNYISMAKEVLELKAIADAMIDKNVRAFNLASPKDRLPHNVNDVDKAVKKANEKAFDFAEQIVKDGKKSEMLKSLANEEGQSVKMSVEKVLIDLEEQRLEAVRVGNATAALKASELQGKHLKMWNDNMYVEVNPFKDKTLAQLKELAEELLSTQKQDKVSESDLKDATHGTRETLQ